jgi:hypothetical protein
MAYGTKLERKLGKWVVYLKETGKIIAKCDSEADANKKKQQLVGNEPQGSPRRK